jgi:single-strand DNA-binding protein
MSAVNIVGISGTIGRIENFITKSGFNILTINMAHNMYVKAKEGVPLSERAFNGYEQETHWFKVKAIGKMAENLSTKLVKGDKIFVAGELKTETWEKDGINHTQAYIEASKIDHLSKGNGQQSAMGAVQGQQYEAYNTQQQYQTYTPQQQFQQPAQQYQQFQQPQQMLGDNEIPF